MNNQRPGVTMGYLVPEEDVGEIASGPKKKVVRNT
jgi:hypothetical protein